MPEVTLTRPTRYGGVGRKSGEVVEVDDATATRWAAKGIAQVNPELTGPFISFPEIVQKSLKEAGLETVEAVKAYGKENLVKLDGIGPKTADDLLAL